MHYNVIYGLMFGGGGIVKRIYEKPEISVKEYASFEKVFAICSKGNDYPQGCEIWDGWSPKGKYTAAYGGDTGS